MYSNLLCEAGLTLGWLLCAQETLSETIFSLRKSLKEVIDVRIVAKTRNEVAIASCRPMPPFAAKWMARINQLYRLEQQALTKPLWGPAAHLSRCEKGSRSSHRAKSPWMIKGRICLPLFTLSTTLLRQIIHCNAKTMRCDANHCRWSRILKSPPPSRVEAQLFKTCYVAGCRLLQGRNIRRHQPAGWRAVVPRAIF